MKDNKIQASDKGLKENEIFVSDEVLEEIDRAIEAYFGQDNSIEEE